MTKTQIFVPIVLPNKKMKRISSHSSLTTEIDSESLKCQKNRKISESVKQKFIEMVTKNNFSMKNAAKIVGISYSTAKKIFTLFRSSLKTASTKTGFQHRDQRELSRASYLQVPILQNKQVQILCLIAGRTQAQ